MISTICKEGDPKAEVLFMFEDGTTELIQYSSPPLFIDSFSDYKRYCYHFWGAYDDNFPADVIWRYFYTLPLGTRGTNAAESIDSGRTRLEVRPYSFAIYIEENFIREFGRNPNSIVGGGLSLLTIPEIYQGLLNQDPNWGYVPTLSLEIYGSFEYEAENLIDISFVFNESGEFYYETPPMEHIYDTSCGGCNSTSFPVNANTPQGYICVPYDDIIEFSKQQRQRLNQIAKDLK